MTSIDKKLTPQTERIIIPLWIRVPENGVISEFRHEVSHPESISQNGKTSEVLQSPPNCRQQFYKIPIKFYIAVCSADENVIATEKTVSENISEGGASFFSGFRRNTGKTVKLKKTRHFMRRRDCSQPALLREQAVAPAHGIFQSPLLVTELINNKNLPTNNTNSRRFYGTQSIHRKTPHRTHSAFAAGARTGEGKQ